MTSVQERLNTHTGKRREGRCIDSVRVRRTHRGDAGRAEELVEGAAQELVLDGEVVAPLLVVPCFGGGVAPQVVHDLGEALAVQLHGHGQRGVGQVWGEAEAGVLGHEADADLLRIDWFGTYGEVVEACGG